MGMSHYVRNQVETRYAKIEQAPGLETKKVHSAISLALDAYISNMSTTHTELPPTLEESFIETVINQVRSCLFAGDDTTSSTIAFCFHALTEHPTTRAIMRQEHDVLFGTGSAAKISKDNSTLLNQCPYTNAFIKETLRLYPPAANMRWGQPGKIVTALNGQVIELYLCATGCPRNPRIWVRPQDFLPARWSRPRIIPTRK